MNANSFVVDSNVGVKWFVAEELAGEALRLVTSGVRLLAVDIFPAEVTNVFLTKLRAGDVGAAYASEAVTRAAAMVQLVSSQPLLPMAWEIAVRFDRSSYDALYMALALQQACRLVTADRRLYNSLKPHYDESLVWLGEIAGAL